MHNRLSYRRSTPVMRQFYITSCLAVTAMCAVLSWLHKLAVSILKAFLAVCRCVAFSCD
jgi:hypothetical protein